MCTASRAVMTVQTVNSTVMNTVTRTVMCTVMRTTIRACAHKRGTAMRTECSTVMRVQALMGTVWVTMLLNTTAASTYCLLAVVLYVVT
jgi:hypothetical protein